MSKFISKLKKRPTVFASFIILIMLYLGMIFAGFISPYSPNTTFQKHSNAPPQIRFYSKQLGFGPQVQRMVVIDSVNWRFARIKGEYYKIKLFVKGPQYKFFGLINTNIHLFGTNHIYENEKTTWEDGGKNYPVFLFGSDHLGRDIFTRILYGSRISLTIGFIGTFISLFLAIILGGLAGFYGGAVDWIIMRISEFFILIPALYLILFLRSVLSKDMDSGQSFIMITVILSLVSWPGKARLIRGLVHSIKREDFVDNAKLEGIPSLVIIFKYIVPQMSSIIIISVALSIPGFILGETVLSYLGLGIVDPSVSWGSLINKNISTLSNLKNYPWFLMPGLFLLLTTMAFNFIGDLLRDISDPYFKDRSIN